jgi:hypothetical protein
VLCFRAAACVASSHNLLQFLKQDVLGACCPAGTAQLGFNKRRRAALAAVRAAASSDVEAAPLRSKAAAPASGSSESSSTTSSSKQLSWLQSKWDRDIWQLAVPAALALAADPLLGMVDTALVGRLGSDELVSILCTCIVLEAEC